VAAGTVTIRLFGAASVEIDRVPVPMHSRRSTALLAFLVLEGPRVHPRASIATMFWDDLAPEAARANLRSVLSTLQSKLPGLLAVTRSTVALDPSVDIDVDVLQFLDAVMLADDSNASIDDRIEACRLALALCGAQLLVGFEHLGISELTNWIESERRSFERRAVSVAATLTDLLIAVKRIDDAVDAAARLIELDRFREASYVVSMRALLAQGEPQRALDEFARCHAALVGDLGVALSPEIGRLEQAVREDTPRGESSRPVLSRIGGLPVRRALFGRDDLVDEVAVAERWPTGGLVTLCGPAGVGKTSLAVTVAHRWREHGRDVVFVDATNADSARHLAEAMSNAIGGPLLPGRDADPLEGVIEVLTDRTVSVVLDNIEQVDEAPQVIRTLLDRCPGLLLLATSRRPMHMVSEEVVDVPPLTTPTDTEVDEDEPGDDASLGSLKRLACVQLFQHRSVISGSKPAASADELRAVGRICQLIDGLPLAIELIASRRQIMGLADIEESVRAGLQSGDLSMIDGGFRDAPERHRGLRAALTSTIALLDADTQRLFARLSVFDGPFSFDAVAALCDEDHHGHGVVVRSIQALVDFRLVVRSEAHGVVWMRMLAPVRAVAASLLSESGDAERVGARRVDHDTELVDHGAAEYFSPANTAWFRLLDEYLPSLRSTLDELHERRDPRELAMVTSLAPYWFDRGRVAEAHHRLSAAVDSAADPSRPWLPAVGRLWRAGMRAESLGYGTAAETLGLVDDALATLCAAQPPASVQLGALRLALHVHVIDSSASLADATRLAERGIELSNSSGQPWFRADFLYTCAVIHHLSGDDQRAAAQFRVAADEGDLHGNRRVALYARMWLDLVDPSGPGYNSREKISELLDLALEIGDYRQTTWLTVILGSIAVLEGDLPRSAAHYLDGLSLSRDAHYFIGIGCCLMGGVGIAIMRGDISEAMRFHASVEPDLESLGRSMPQVYLQIYRELTNHLHAEAVADPDLAVARSSGSVGPRSTILNRLAEYLTHVRSDHSVGESASVTFN
jgi:predicted ATPase/DNA-binding SARP family transcriptional activator